MPENHYSFCHQRDGKKDGVAAGCQRFNRSAAVLAALEISDGSSIWPTARVTFPRKLDSLKLESGCLFWLH